MKLFFLIITYPSFELTLFKYGLPVGGILEVNRNLFSSQAINLAYYSYLMGIGINILILWSVRNNLYEYKIINFSNGVRVFLFVAMIFASLLFKLNGHRSPDDDLFTLDGVVILSETPYIIFNVLLLISRKSISSFSSIIHSLFLLILIISGERVASIVTILLLLVMGGGGERFSYKGTYW
ncbi:MAG: hypothetical protein LBU03_00385 [Tannerellaceae bacterium]|nr:hypothetical protein [Tannerellaceae bacterium]